MDVSLFEVLGPVMIGPSSSTPAGPAGGGPIGRDAATERPRGAARAAA